MSKAGIVPVLLEVSLMGSPFSSKESSEVVAVSLHKNMEMITRRANAGGGVDASDLKSLVLSTSSKSLSF
ncbi:hypothetical protein V6N13_062985 [Hibiscus sabdariffa]